MKGRAVKDGPPLETRGTMDTRIGPALPDVVTVPSEPRPTPRKATFSEVLATGATSVVQSAEAAMTALPGLPLMALAVRGGSVQGAPLGPGLPTPGLGSPSGLPGAPGLPGGLGGVPPGLPAGLGGAPGTGLAAEGPGGLATGGSFGAALAAGLPGALMGDGGIQASLMQSQQMNLYYLQVQQEVDAENRTFTTLSNVLKAENDTVKNAIGNIH
jgi:hypothetical protein